MKKTIFCILHKFSTTTFNTQDRELSIFSKVKNKPLRSVQSLKLEALNYFVESLFWQSARLVFKAVCPLGIFQPSFNMLPVIDYDNVKIQLQIRQQTRQQGV